MKIEHDREGDILKITLNDKPEVYGELIGGSDVILHFDERDNNIVAIEILAASTNAPHPNLIEFVEQVTV
jgi:uncharacterized protein YuzE